MFSQVNQDKFVVNLHVHLFAYEFGRNWFLIWKENHRSFYPMSGLSNFRSWLHTKFYFPMPPSDWHAFTGVNTYYTMFFKFYSFFVVSTCTLYLLYNCYYIVFGKHSELNYYLVTITCHMNVGWKYDQLNVNESIYFWNTKEEVTDCNACEVFQRYVSCR